MLRSESRALLAMMCPTMMLARNIVCLEFCTRDEFVSPTIGKSLTTVEHNKRWIFHDQICYGRTWRNAALPTFEYSFANVMIAASMWMLWSSEGITVCLALRYRRYFTMTCRRMVIAVHTVPLALLRYFSVALRMHSARKMSLPGSHGSGPARRCLSLRIFLAPLSQTWLPPGFVIRGIF